MSNRIPPLLSFVLNSNSAISVRVRDCDNQVAIDVTENENADRKTETVWVGKQELGELIRIFRDAISPPKEEE